MQGLDERGRRLLLRARRHERREVGPVEAAQ